MAVNHLLGVAAFSQYTVAAQESLVKLPADAPWSGRPCWAARS